MPQKLSRSCSQEHRQQYGSMVATKSKGPPATTGSSWQSLRMFQAEYHRDKFRNFPHVESPARLIREIVRPSLRPSTLLPRLQ